MEDGTAGIAEARVDLHQVGRFRPLVEPVAPRNTLRPRSTTTVKSPDKSM